MPEPDWGLKLYSHNVLIQEKSKDLLPVYFRFVKGVVDSEDVPLNVSRETVQLNKVLERIKKSLTSKVINEIKKMASKEPDNYKKFWEEFGIFIKEGVASDQTNKEKLSKLLRFKSTKLADDEYTSLDAYIERMSEDQEKVYYLLADNLTVAKRSPHLEYFSDKGYEVLLLVEPIDGFIMMNLRDYEGKTLESIDQSTPDAKTDDKKEDKKDEDKDEFDKLLDKFKAVLGEKIEDVRFTDRLKESPIRLVNPKTGLGSEMQRVYKAMDENFEIPKKILEMNKNHPIITGISNIYSNDADSELVVMTIEQLFENALLQEGFHPQPGSMVPRINQIIEAAVKK
jgi:molecular chaperone HtpG